MQKDRGGEYYNTPVQTLLKNLEIKLYSTYSQERKAATVERTIHTLKNRIYTFLTGNNTRGYIDHLNFFVEAYHNSYLCSIMNTPVTIHALASNEEIDRQFEKMCLNVKDKTKVKPSHSLSVGDAVWIVRAAYTGWFFRGFTESNSERLFIIKTIETSEGNVPVYHLEDLGKESRRIS